ncbi:MAG: hypothetical protein IKZ88_10235 [Neisseriaceae bacterium]|nr:hypothetical protein [Neisseriaceae bacterium]
MANSNAYRRCWWVGLSHPITKPTVLWWVGNPPYNQAVGFGGQECPPYNFFRFNGFYKGF